MTSTSSDNVYYNIDMLGQPGQNNQMIYDVTLNQPLVYNSASYYLSVIQFAIPLSSVPIMIAPVIPGSGLTNTMPLQLTFIVNGIAMPAVNLIFVPEELSQPQPNQNNPNQQIITPYYFLFSYETLINIINTGLLTAYNAMKIAYPAIAQSIANPPFIFYDPATQLISLVTHISYATNIAQVNTVNIQINEDLLNYLEAFSFTFITDALGNNFYKFNIFTQNENGYPTNTYPVAPTYIQNTQSYNVINYWSDLKRILISSSSLPIANESVENSGGTIGVLNNQPILSSFTPQTELAGQGRSIVYYEPTSQYKLLDITDNIDIRRINVAVFWQDYALNVYPIILDPLQSASIRIAFLKKDLYKGTLLKKF